MRYMMVAGFIALLMGVVQAQTPAEFRTLLRQAQDGNAQAQAEVGMAYLRGVGTFPDDSEACAWLTIAAVQGVKQAADFAGLACIGAGTSPEESRKARDYWDRYVVQ